MERAFYGPQLLKDRLGEELTPESVVSKPIEDLEVVFWGPPAIHRYPASMAKRTQELAQAVIDDYDGRAENLWDTAEDGAKLLQGALPGLGRRNRGSSSVFSASASVCSPRAGGESSGLAFHSRRRQLR